MRAAGLLVLIPLLLALPTASAHADLSTATPAPGGHADEGITVVELVFTEDVERGYTTADVRNEQDQSMAAGPVEFDEAAHNVIRLPVKPLPSGIYSASWKALSADTHTTRGVFVFAIGNATLRPGEYASHGSDPQDYDAGMVARDGFARFAFYTGLFLTAGMPLFALVVLRDMPPRALFLGAASFGVVGAAGALVGLLFLQERTGLGWGLLDTAPGASLLRRGLWLMGAALACMAAASLPRWRIGAWAAVGFGALAIYQTATGSHAAALRESTTLYVAADALHLAAATIWVGGIAGFLHVVALREGRSLSALVHRFTALAIPSVVLLLGTGTLASIAHMPCFDEGVAVCLAEAPTEPYMRLVAIKLGLMLPLVALGAFNALFVKPRVADGSWSRLRFRRAVQIEAVLLAVVVGAAGVLAASPPPDQEVIEGTQPPPAILELQNATRTSHIIVQIDPNPVIPGEQHVVIIVHPLGPQLPNSTQVAIKAYPATSPEPGETLNPTKVTPNEWEITGQLFATPEAWKLMVILQRPDEYAQVVFDVPVVSPFALANPAPTSS